MTLWLVAQIFFAAIAWYVAARAVLNAFSFGGDGSRDLVRTVRDLCDAGRAADIPRLGEMLAPSPLTTLLVLGGGPVNEDRLVAASEEVLESIRPPTRLLRGLATVGTTMGLLAAVMTLRFALDLGSPARMEYAAARAFDSAVVGFVTGLPCWTAMALCGQRLRQAFREIDLLITAMTSTKECDVEESDTRGPGRDAE